jgi:hypothetical protein
MLPRNGFPDFASADIADHRCRNAVFFPCWPFSQGIGVYRNDQFFRQFGIAVGFAGQAYISAFCTFVGLVVGMCSQKQVRGVHTARIIAAMQNALLAAPVWKGERI